MHKTPYCSRYKGEHYPHLLRFSRVTKASVDAGKTEQVQQETMTALLSMTEPMRPSCRALLPLIYHNTDLTGIRDRFPENLRSFLQKNTLLLIGREMSVQHCLGQSINLLRDKKIPVLLLKGAAFAETLYPAKFPRVGADIDLLVREADFEQACTLMGTTMAPVLLETSRVATHATLFERVFRPKNGVGPIVEIHRGLTNPSIFRIDEKSLWAESTVSPVYNSESVRLLSPEDTLLHLAVYAFRDLDFCTHNILDGHQVWCQWNPDPKRLLQRAEQWGAQKVLYYLLANCQAIMGTPIPDAVLETLQPGKFTNMINATILKKAQPKEDKKVNRVLQLLSQLTFPDAISGGLKFQLGYAKTRFADWLIARKG